MRMSLIRARRGHLRLLAILPDALWSSLIPAGGTDDVKSYKGGRGVLAINQAGSSEGIMMLNSMRLFSASFPLAHGSGRALINHR